MKNETTVTTAKKEINFDLNLISKLANYAERSTSNGRKQIYKDDATVNISGKDIKYAEAKTSFMLKPFRNAMRKKLERYSINLITAYKGKNIDRTNEALNIFLDFYKNNYLLNDFSASSLTSSLNETTQKLVSDMLAVIQQIKK